MSFHIRPYLKNTNLKIYCCRSILDQISKAQILELTDVISFQTASQKLVSKFTDVIYFSLHYKTSNLTCVISFQATAEKLKSQNLLMSFHFRPHPQNSKCTDVISFKMTAQFSDLKIKLVVSFDAFLFFQNPAHIVLLPEKKCLMKVHIQRNCKTYPASLFSCLFPRLRFCF